jgi:chromosomal replication initiator protein
MDDLFRDDMPQDDTVLGSNSTDFAGGGGATDRQRIAALRQSLAERVGADRFALWFGSQTELCLADDQLTILVPSAFFQEWMRKNFRQQILDACAEVLGRSIALAFQVVDNTNNDGLPVGDSKDSVRNTTDNGAERPNALLLNDIPSPDLPDEVSLQTAHASNTLLLQVDGDAASAKSKVVVATDSVTLPQTKPDEAPCARRRRFGSLDDFVVGPSNRLAASAARQVALRPGAANPLVIHGPTGSGKTHLLEGIWTSARRARPGAQALLLSAEQFTSQFLGALHGSGLPSFRRKYRGVELLLIDDVQFFAGKRATLVELLFTVDTLLREGRQLVFATDRAPEQQPDLGAELIARLQGGLVCPVEAPEYEARLGIVRRFGQQLGVEMPQDVQEFIAAQLATHARALQGAVNRLLAASLANDEPITLSLARTALADLTRNTQREVRLADIEAATCSVFGLEPKMLQTSDVGKRVNYPRMLAMWLARKHTRAALSEIGQYFGRRSHSTVISAQKKVAAWVVDSAQLSLADHSVTVDEVIRRVEEKLRVG